MIPYEGLPTGFMSTPQHGVLLVPSNHVMHPEMQIIRILRSLVPITRLGCARDLYFELRVSYFRYIFSGER